ncbi:PaaI family thioesterase [Nocardioides kongjuensis]|uniref:Acyl-coenzyme A thioesterase THEM4 n=1 Tax=Nocardioides kongjuensis TaxID=349522 RepID=A0A852R206_9ACTN|nr:PaaI family thioesterase [Nocardioides kongjuensis]NYD28793.1 acyl-coenzyme A thioesterase PaaI-like protein [Nocardioides kongjuensis]
MTLTELTARPDESGIDTAVAAVRRLAAALLAAGGRVDLDLDDLARRLSAMAGEVEGLAPELADRMVDMWSGEGVTRHDPVTGPENAIAPPLVLCAEDGGSVAGTVNLGIPYQGPPGCVHGGISALLLDHTLGVANAHAGTSGMTGTLTLRYERPVPLHTDLVVRGWQERVEGRKIWSHGTITSGEEVLVRAEGLFIDKHLARPGQEVSR